MCTIEERRRERRNIVNKMESLMKNQEELMKDDGKAINLNEKTCTLAVIGVCYTLKYFFFLKDGAS